MKRDWDLVRKILFKLEEASSVDGNIRSDGFEGYDAELVAYHMHIMKQRELIDAQCFMKQLPPLCIVNSMSWEGQELLSNIRRDTIWQKGAAREKSVDLSIDVIKALASAFIKNQLGVDS